MLKLVGTDRNLIMIHWKLAQIRLVQIDVELKHYERVRSDVIAQTVKRRESSGYVCSQLDQMIRRLKCEKESSELFIMRVNNCMEFLPHDAQKILQMYYGEGLEVAAIGDILGYSQGHTENIRQYGIMSVYVAMMMLEREIPSGYKWMARELNDENPIMKFKRSGGNR